MDQSKLEKKDGNKTFRSLAVNFAVIGNPAVARGRKRSMKIHVLYLLHGCCNWILLGDFCCSPKSENVTRMRFQNVLFSASFYWRYNNYVASYELQDLKTCQNLRINIVKSPHKERNALFHSQTIHW